jgi:molecular chaperone GrpE
MKKTDASESLFDEILSEDDEDSYAMADIFEDDSEQEEQESDLIKENSVLSKRVEDLTSSYLNLAADFENFKKRNTKNLEDSRKFALESIMKDLIEVLDNFERALASSDNEGGDKNLIEGIKNTHRQLMTLLESHGLSKIPTEP